MDIFFECKYKENCASRSEEKCKKCKNNTMRNYIRDYFEESGDKPIPEKCPPLHYAGPAEQTAGYCCPVCGGFTSPYHTGINGKRCRHCGYQMNIK